MFDKGEQVVIEQEGPSPGRPQEGGRAPAHDPKTLQRAAKHRQKAAQMMARAARLKTKIEKLKLLIQTLEQRAKRHHEMADEMSP